MIDDAVYGRNTCRLCGSTRLVMALPLAATPLGDDFIAKDRLGETQPLYPLDIVLCENCGNAQLSHVVSPEAIYEHYVYTTSVSLGLVDHFEGYAQEVMDRVKPASGGLVVEIGSNEGALLRAFQSRGMVVLGVDPAKEIAKTATASGVETIGDYFSGELGTRLAEQRGKASVVSANNVFANLDDLDDMTQGIRALMAEDGVFVFETSYCLAVVEHALLDTVFHEHLTYFSVAPMAQFFARHGMEFIDVRLVPTKGGSIRGTLQLIGGPRTPAPTVKAAIDAERAAGIHEVRGWRAFAERLEEIKAGTLAIIEDLKRNGGSVAAYGAAVGLTTMIYQFELGGSLDFIADDNPAKQGRFSPGLHLTVLPSSALLESKPEAVVVLAWRYVDAIAAKNREYLEQGGKFILPLPTPHIY